MNNIAIHPWIGKDYESGGMFDQRVMFLGLSSYLPEKAYKKKTEEELNAHLQTDTCNFGVKRTARNSFWTNIQQLGLGKPVGETSEKEREEFWHSVALYNYVPFVVADGPRKDPSDEHLKSAASEFKDVMEEHKPDRLVVMSWDVHHQLKKQFEEYKEVVKKLEEVDGQNFQIRSLNIGDHRCLTVRIRHPSGGLSWKIARKAFEQLLACK